MEYATWKQVASDRQREAAVQRILSTPSHRTTMAGIKPAARFAYADLIVADDERRAAARRVSRRPSLWRRIVRAFRAAIAYLTGGAS